MIWENDNLILADFSDTPTWLRKLTVRSDQCCWSEQPSFPEWQESDADPAGAVLMPEDASNLEKQLKLKAPLTAHVACLFCFAGTTCLIALLSDKDLTVANVGDSRGVLCDKDGNAIPLSHDHKPYQLKERKRIKRAGELISASKDSVLSCSSGQGSFLERHSFTQWGADPCKAFNWGSWDWTL